VRRRRARGIFGNVSDTDIRATVGAVTSLLAPGGTVIWTRGRRGGEDDLRPVVRRWFSDAGLTKVAFDGAPETFGVGVARRDPGVAGAPGVPPLPGRLFTFAPSPRRSRRTPRSSGRPMTVAVTVRSSVRATT
jgi:hypothetical protein